MPETQREFSRHGQDSEQGEGDGKDGQAGRSFPSHSQDEANGGRDRNSLSPKGVCDPVKINRLINRRQI
ncbi:hypothetical protein, partial [Streptococcus pneumoniae]|uniref:hypothetical protein n=1 Tax=Streptococcus pneumoniae TaxID=1313 RepID=UPI001E485C40